MDEVEQLFSNPEVVMDIMRDARKAFTSSETSSEQLDAVEKVLGLAYLYGPENLQGWVQATLEELGVRRLHMDFRRWNMDNT